MISDKTIAQIVQRITNLSEEKKQNLYKFFLELKNNIKNNQFDITEEIENIKTYIDNKINETVNNLINGAPESYDTLKEIADKLEDNDDVVVQILTSISERLKIEDYIKPVQSDWTEQDDTKLSFIKNKPDSIDSLSYGVEWDVTDSDPVLIRVGNMHYHRTLPIQSAFRGCVCKGKNIQYYLNPMDWSKREDGQDSNLDGTDGTIRIHTPKFYGRSFIKGNKRQVRISPIQIDETWIEIPELVIDAYHCTLDRRDVNLIKTASVKNTSQYFRGGNNNEEFDYLLNTDPGKTHLGKAVSWITIREMRNYAANDNSELLCYEFYKWIFYWCPVIEYANFNLQEDVNKYLDANGFAQGGLGVGMTRWNFYDITGYNDGYPVTPSGYSNILGNFSGEVDLIIPSFDYMNGDNIIHREEQVCKVNRYRGFENIFGDVETVLEGIYVDKTDEQFYQESGFYPIYSTTDKNLFSVVDNASYKLIGNNICRNGRIKEFDLRDSAEIIPSAILSSSVEGIGYFDGYDFNKDICLCITDTERHKGSMALPCSLSTQSPYYVIGKHICFRTCSRITN